MYNDFTLANPKSPYIRQEQSVLSPIHSLKSQAYSLPQAYPLFPPASSSTQCSFDLLKGKVDHLENERINLSVQIQDLSEKDRSKKMKIEQLESDLRSSQSAQSSLKTANEDTIEKLRIMRDCKEEHLSTIIKLNERMDAQAKETSGAQNLWSKMTAANRELKRLEEENLKSHREKTEVENEKEELAAEITKLREINDKKQEEMTLVRLEIEGQRLTFKDSKTALECANATCAAELVAVKMALNEVSKSNEEEKERIRSDYIDEIEELKRELEAKSLLMSVSNEEDEMDKLSSVAIDDLRKKLLLSEMKRKQLHNTLQELRGNIRVFVRCRPFLQSDTEEYFSSIENIDPSIGGCVKFHKDGNSISLLGLPAASNRGTPQIFSFDQVFKCESTQDEVFAEVSDLVQSALDGYKVCIFSYGQTGSGKTHTMTGGKDGEMRGIIPRSVEQIIQQVMLMRSNGWEIVVTTSMVEIYNEDLRDLLTTTVTTATTASEKEKLKLKISNLQGFVTISGLTSVELNTQDLRGGMRQLEGLLDHAAKSRMTACTAMNERSSRSHALFMLDIQAKHSDGVTFLRGGLRLCDLAGSERLDRTGTANDATRLKETVNINKSLSCLADVFVSLGNKSSHIPYRNSKLTMVLQDCLSGDGKALMFVNVSPTNGSSQESLCSLRFASQVNQVELGKATKSIFTIPAQFQPQLQPQLQLQPQAVNVSSHLSANTGMSSAAIRGTARVTGVKRGANFAHSQNSNQKGDNTLVYPSASTSLNGNVPNNNYNGCHTTQQQLLNSSCELPGSKKLRSNATVTSVMGTTMPNNNATRSSSWR